MYIADLHIHSRFSRATSKEGTPEMLQYWAGKKGIHLVGTGDFTHPAWREELKEKLVPAEDGFYRLKKEYQIAEEGFEGEDVRFVVTGEISSIYKKKDRVRKVHSLILLPGLEEAEELSARLEAIGNIHSDGRPILGLACRDLLELTMEVCPRAIYIPAHIWTPHFSLFGAFSGFDAIEDCYEDMTPYIHALETGLSSDPPMNWRLSALDSYQLVSNSDAHSPAKLGREANLLEIEHCYQGLYDAVQAGKGLEGTIEFFPEEGKYHFDGHRKCHLCMSPTEADAYGGKCPVCGKRLTIGVSHRVEQLADRPEGYVRPGAKAFESLVPLEEVIAASTGRSSASKKVQEQYRDMLKRLGSEFSILREVPIEDIKHASGYLISEGIRRLREGKVTRKPGFDGEYGTIQLFSPSEISNLDGQMSLFTEMEWEAMAEKEPETAFTLEPFGGKEIKEETALKEQFRISKEEDEEILRGLNDQQREAVLAKEPQIAVIAGPGTGKTKTLVSKILYLLRERNAKPSEITAVTFTKKAAEEIRQRIGGALGKRIGNALQIGTFHSICYAFLKERYPDCALADEFVTAELAEAVLSETGKKGSAGTLLKRVSLWKTTGEEPEEEWREPARRYQERLSENRLLDFDDLLLEALKERDWGSRFSYLFIDEFQDVSPVQYRLAQAWAKEGKEFFIIGDPDQSIYGFRGADSKCFQRLIKDAPNARIIRLRKNYRSAPEIVEGAAAVISHNRGEERCLEAVCRKGTPIRLITASSSWSEAIFTAKEINRLMGGIGMLETDGRVHTEQERSFGDIAVLYRTRRQSARLEQCLRKEGIPYVVAGREDFLLEKKVRRTICFFKWLLRQDDTVSYEIGRKLFAGPEEEKEKLPSILETYLPAVRKEKPGKLLKQWAALFSMEEEKGIKKLLNMAHFYKNMDDFLDSLSFGVENDLKRAGESQYSSDAVTLMTLHSAKGLEFPEIILHGVQKGMLPLEGGNASQDLEEERRLFYVGMTRAKEALTITFSGEPSVFLAEIPNKDIVREEAEKPKKKEEDGQMSLFDFMK